MSFIKKIKTPKKAPLNNGPKIPFYKKKGWKVFFAIFGLVLIVSISFFGYLIASGSKMFENGFGSGSSLIKTLYGKEELRGESTGRINILVAGMGGISHPGGMLADSLIFMSFDPQNKKAGMISIPRDLLVPISGHGEDKINSSFSNGYTDYINKNCNKKNRSLCYDDAVVAGAKLTKETVSSILDQPIDYYITLDFEGFEKIIDQLGGVDIQVEKAIYDPTFPAKDMKRYEPFRIKAGKQHLDGVTALKYARSRHTTSDFDRAKRQQQIIGAAKDKAMQAGIVGNPKKISDIISILGNSVKTDFTLPEIKAFLELFNDIPSGQIKNKVLSTEAGGPLVDFNNGVYYQKPRTGNFKEIQGIAKNIFAEEEDTTPSKIELLNGSDKTGLATKTSASLTEAGFQVIKVGNNSQKIAKTVIYDYTTSNKSKKLALLKEKLKLSSLTVEKKIGGSAGVDFTVIIGQDFVLED